jgi:hypothetical protein
MATLYERFSSAKSVRYIAECARMASFAQNPGAAMAHAECRNRVSEIEPTAQWDSRKLNRRGAAFVQH